MSFGYQLMKNGKLVMAPDFLPYCLNQVIDVAPAEGKVVRTSIPNGKPCVVFFRATSYVANASLYFIQRQGSAGYWELEFHYGMAFVDARVYIFSDTLPNIPDIGFFLYRNGSIVWHGNCLPLSVRPYSDLGGETVFSYPLAVPSCVCNFTSVGNTVEHWDRWFVFMAGPTSSGQYNVGRALFSQFNASGPPTTSGFDIPMNSYIETSVYDTYYKQSLGI
ncbi:hypothetical protein KI694_09880 [Enterobacter oligotrophicus]|uniref:hypothetical protein n=1 Tax=Enterobacter oligotrophicus TaxID=2478464 RepID=UPI001C0329C7|nr:hypothetical protein [Enterobacter oligotrophicus]MBT9425838.1 hypothetical protein [Enterobacter oligotrophicus]